MDEAGFGPPGRQANRHGTHLATPVSHAHQPSGGPLADKDLLSVPEAVQYTGLSAATLWRYMARSRLPKIQHGGSGCRVLLRRSDLLNLASSTSQASNDPPAGSVPPKSSGKLAGRQPAWKSRTGKPPS